ncbi:hypothetical protein COU78_04700 [Candidatus Peregrinibacteria bacterium CG10_big_fil_rev_8_21_14_0_10_49_24]|nr:MAG: hypothetical protein COV83_03845 [Candidatus Peregrinibacteria bacterium CG11_big_fil_rev_8_21_14_0_20_49_14]PIR50650.1 MAG: hypothetical protein COU78_04700 [Candidatus Peregrinibacteria bacterium CG10_big_fil_rev_8_21_14_0_10_49_24]PJA67734.1 MAG: hypothetical protein CO157_02990 [Candidatus Peregrinibacteria bacterium CG_4_9_14_3_um_filter_49_12]
MHLYHHFVKYASILIAEDDPLLRDLYKRKFSMCGYGIRVVENGAEAIAAIEESVPDVAILDINMPVMDGFSVLEKYPEKQRPFSVIMLTNFGDEKNKKRGESLGVSKFFIKKDMTIKTLIEMVESHLEKS